MPVATPEIYAEMLDKAKRDSFAFPAINVSSSQTLNAALAGFAEAESDGIIQVSTGGAEYFSGPTVKDMVSGSLGFAAFAQEVAKKYPVNVALHTDHCPKDKLDGFVRPLIAASTERVQAGGLPYFQSHMWDGSAVPLDENLTIAQELLELAAAAHIILEVEIGVVGGEEDGVEAEINDKLYTSPEDALATAEALGLGEKGRYLTALTFGNVHGVYKPGNVKLRPEVLDAAQKAVAEKYGQERDDAGVVVIARHDDGRVAGFLSFVPWGEDGISLDLMRRSPEAVNGIVELMVTTLLADAGQVGVTRVSLNFAAFRSVFARGERIGAGPVLRMWRAVLLWASRFAQIEALYRSNVKYRPEWVPRYLVYGDVADLPRVASAVLRAEALVVAPAWYRRISRKPSRAGAIEEIPEVQPGADVPAVPVDHR